MVRFLLWPAAVDVGSLTGRPGLQALLGRAPAHEVDPTDRGAPLPAAEGRAYCHLIEQSVGPEVWTARVPAAVVQAFLQAGPCLVVGDAPGDPDCFGSAAGWARARRALGLPAAVHVDAPPPQSVRRVLEIGEVLSAEQVSAARYPTVVLVDNDGTRIGPAAEAAIARAQRVVVVDHHDVNPTRESLGMRPDAELIVWRDTGADAAALMTLAVMLRGLEASQISWTKQAWREVLEPLLVAIYSDTRGLDAHHSRPATAALLRTILDLGGLSASELFAAFGKSMPRAVRSSLVDGVREESERHGQEQLGLFALDATVLLGAWHSARAHAPELTWSDTLFAVLDHVESRVHQAGYDVAVLAAPALDESARSLPEELRLQLPKGALRFSVRSKEGAVAARLAKHLGGGGKLHEGGGTVDTSPAELFQQTRRWMERRAAMIEHARLRSRGSL